MAKIVFQISEHKSIIFPKVVQRMDKMPANLAVCMSVNFLPALPAESTTRGFQSSVQGPALVLSRSYYPCCKPLCEGRIQGVNQKLYFPHI